MLKFFLKMNSFLVNGFYLNFAKKVKCILKQNIKQNLPQQVKLKGKVMLLIASVWPNDYTNEKKPA